MDSRRLEHFLAAFRHGSLGRAAAELHISQPGLSKSIRQLERELEVKLFERTPMGLQPTVFGEALATHASSVQSELDSASREIAMLRGAAKGVVRIGVTPSVAASLMPVFAAIGVPGGIIAYIFSTSQTFLDVLAIAGGLGTMVGLAAYPDGLAARMAYDARRLRGWLKARLARYLPFASGPSTAPNLEAGQSIAAVRRSEHELRVDGLEVRFGGVVALDGVSLSVRSGEILALIGPNGAGKTTLIDAVTGLAPCHAGTICLDGERIDGWPVARRARAGIARSFQSLELFDDMTVEENLRAAAERPASWSYIGDLVRPANPPLPVPALRAIEDFRLGNDLHRLPEELSFGRRRMVGIVRAVAAQPSVILLDEPAAGLDESESLELAGLLRMLAEARGLAVLLIEHDMNLVMSVSDRVVALDFGRKIAQGAPGEVRHDRAVIDAYLGAEAPLDPTPPRLAIPGRGR
ncbi:MAG: ATP-binding cassette domain-containing protein [Solirubrobacterales bacterium]|nr:ATP-binding cassette domain-containing protein [Solirubrobacterales bacterium]